MNLQQLFDSANKKLGGVPITTESVWLPRPLSTSVHGGVEYRLYDQGGVTIKLSDNLFEDLGRTRELFSMMIVEMAKYEQTVKEFEESVVGFDLVKDSSGKYESINTGRALVVWQAAKQKYAP